jgi:hypothetical protein
MEIADKDAREQIQKLVRSDLFRFSELQRRLLIYLSDKSLSGEADQLKEYTIAVDALGKPESYDPRRDSTVRLQSSKLRQKISEYYRTAGQSDAVLVDFPKGRFALVFRYREPSPPPVPDQIGSRRQRVALASIAALAVILAGLCVYWGTALYRLKRQNAVAAEALTPALKEFWSPFRNNEVTLICVGAPLFIRLPQSDLLLRRSEVNSWDEAKNSGLIGKLNRLFPGQTPEPWRRFTGVGEAGGAVLIGNLLSTGGLHLYFADSDDLTWNEIGEHNVVFVGPSKFISQIKDLPVMRDVVLEPSGIRNLKPRAGEPAFLEDEYTDVQHQNGHTFALISRLPGLHGNSEILILGGTWTEGTFAAAQYLTLENDVAELLSKIRLPSGALPRYFEAVISVTTEGSTPVQVSYVFHHVLAPSQRVPASR